MQKYLVWVCVCGVVSLVGCRDDEPNPQDIRMPDQGDAVEDMGQDLADAAPSLDLAQPDGGVEQDMPLEDMDVAESLSIPGLSAPVSVRMDAHGVVFLSCETDNDCFAAQGYVHAKHRMFAMDLLRRQTLGKLSAGLGALALELDLSFRHLMTTPDGEPLEQAYLAALDEPTRTALEAYAAGVNAYLADVEAGVHGAELSNEYDFPLLSKEIPAWTPVDSIAVYMQLAYQLGERSQAELERTEFVDVLGVEMASDIFTVRPGTQSSVFGGAGVMPPPPSARAERDGVVIGEGTARTLLPARRALSAARKKLKNATSLIFGPQSDAQGSNNWVLAPERTLAGKALLGNDPHLSMNNPSLWHYIVMDSKTSGSGQIHVAGASIPAVPGIVIGHNEKLAWGTTTARLDMSDVYIETLNEAGDAVIFNGQEVPILKKDYTFEIYLGQPEVRTLEWVPHHGPLIAKDVENRRGVSIKWVAHQGGEDLNFFIELMKAESVDAGTEALQKIRALNQSWVLADAEGEIAWYPHSYIPNRPWGSIEQPSWLALPGDGSAEWDGFVMGEQGPQMRSPASGLIITANGDFDGSYNDGNPFNDGHTLWQWVPTQGYRFDRIARLMQDVGDDHTPETMLEIQADVYVEYAASMLPDLLASVDREALSEDAKAVFDALSAWRYKCPTGLEGSDAMGSMASSLPMEVSEAAGCAAFHVLLKQVSVAIFADELEPLEEFDARQGWHELQRAVHQIVSFPGNLNRGESYFDDVSTQDVVEGRQETLALALEETAKELVDLFGAPSPDQWLWGRIHVLLLESFFMQAGIDTYNAGGQANDGGFETVDVAPPLYYGAARDTYGHNHGASMRTVIELDTDSGFKTWYQLPGGQVHKRDDPRYQSLLEGWLANRPEQLPFLREDVEREVNAEIFEIAPQE